MTTRKTQKAGPTANGSWAGSLEEWKARAGPHNVTLESGMQVTFRVMGLGELMQQDAIPEHLSDLVTLHLLNADKGGIDAVIAGGLVASYRSEEDAAAFQKQLRDAAELTKRLVSAALVEPKISYDELEEMVTSSSIPWGDLEELMRLCTGQKAFDSRGVRIGVEPLATAARFHHTHGLELDPELGVAGCEGCSAYRQELSSVHLGQV